MRKIIYSLAIMATMAMGVKNVSASVYAAKPGDSLCRIGAKFGVACKDMIAGFPGKNPNLIHPGDKFEFGIADGLFGGTVSKPYTFSPNTVIRSSDVNSDFDTLYTLVNGNIENVNIKTLAGILASKISGTAIIATPSSSQTISVGSSTYQLIVKGATNQTTGILEVQNVSGVKLFEVNLDGANASGTLYFTTTTHKIYRDGTDLKFVDPASGATWTLTQLANSSALNGGNAIDISANAVNLMISSTTGMATDTANNLYQKINANYGLQTEPTDGLQVKVDQSTILFNGSGELYVETATSPAKNRIIMSTASGTIPQTWIATSTGDGVNGNFLRSTSTGVFYDSIGSTGGVSTTATHGVVDTSYRNTSTLHNGKALLVVITITLSGGSGTNGQADIYMSSSSQTGAPVTTLVGRTHLNNDGGSGVSNSGYQMITLIVPTGFYWMVDNITNSLINNIYEMEL